MDKLNIGIASDSENNGAKKDLIVALKKLGFNIIDVNSPKDVDGVDASVSIHNAFMREKINRGIIVDDFGSIGFMAASKFKGFIVAQLADEHSARMTRAHNNTNVITLATKLTAFDQMVRISNCFLNSDFDGGRHMVRINMLEALLKGEK